MQSKANKPTLKTADGKTYNVPVEGSLGLLALGYQGLQAWRQKQKEAGYKLDHLNFPEKGEEMLEE